MKFGQVSPNRNSDDFGHVGLVQNLAEFCLVSLGRNSVNIQPNSVESDLTKFGWVALAEIQWHLVELGP